MSNTSNQNPFPELVDVNKNNLIHVPHKVKEIASKVEYPQVVSDSGKPIDLKAQLVGFPNRKYGAESGNNFLIQGDNLLVTKLLQKSLLGKVRCIYLDPPYNNQETYRHFNDSLNHDEWIEFITERLKELKPLLSDDGSIWISIDDREAHYLKVAADSVFGRENFITTIIWQQRTTRENRRSFSVSHEYLFVYAKDPRTFRTRRNLLTPDPSYYSRYKNPDSDPKGPWQSVSANAQDGHATKSQYYALQAPNGKIHYPPKGRVWVYTQEKMMAEIEAGRIWFGKSGFAVPRIKKYLPS